MSGAGNRVAGSPSLSPTKLARMQSEGIEIEIEIMATAGTGAQNPSPLDLIFSCAICQVTVPQIYAQHDGNRGLRSTDDSNKGVITKLWLTECAHLTCGKHLDGGGAPFHPKGQAPRAPCPFCSAEKGDTSPKALFAIHGFKKGDYDSQIPESYFQTPPIQLGAGNAGLEAMRFQYLALIRYGIKKQATLEDAERQLRDLQLEKAADAAKMVSLEAKVAQQEGKVKYWKEREPDITRYLTAFNPMVQELHKARMMLRDLNLDVSGIDHAFGLTRSPTSHAIAQQQGTGLTPQRKGSITIALSKQRGESRLAQGSIADLEALNNKSPAAEALYALPKSPCTAQAPQDRKGSPGKRRRPDTASDAVYDQRYVPGGHTFQRGESRNAMPPPALPMPFPAKASSVAPNVQAYATPNSRGHINPTNRVPQHEVPGDNTPLTPRFSHYSRQTDYLASAPSHGFEVGSGLRSPSVVDRRSASEYRDRNAHYYDTWRSVPETLHGTQPQSRRVDQPYQRQQSSFEQGAPRTASFVWTPYQPQQSSFEDTTMTAIGVNAPFHAPAFRNSPTRAYPHSYSTNPQTSSTNRLSDIFRGPAESFHHQRTSHLHDGELDQKYYQMPARSNQRTVYISPDRPRLTLPPQTPTIMRNGVTPNRRTGTGMSNNIRSSTAQMPTPARYHREPLGVRSSNQQSSVASPFFGREQVQQPRPAPRAMTASLQVINGLSFIQDPRTGNTSDSYPAGGRRPVQR